MSRIVQCSAVVAAGVAGALLLLGPAQASTPRSYGPACAGPVSVTSLGRLACRYPRTARRYLRAPRPPMMADAGLSLVDVNPYVAGRYVSLLILGIGY